MNKQPDKKLNSNEKELSKEERRSLVARFFRRGASLLLSKNDEEDKRSFSEIINDIQEIPPLDLTEDSNSASLQNQAEKPSEKPHVRIFKEKIEGDRVLRHKIVRISNVILMLKNDSSSTPDNSYSSVLGYDEVHLKEIMQALISELSEQRVSKGDLAGIFEPKDASIDIFCEEVLGLNESSKSDDIDKKLTRFKKVIKKYDELLDFNQLSIVGEIEKTRRQNPQHTVREIAEELKIDNSKKPKFDIEHVNKVLKSEKDKKTPVEESEKTPESEKEYYLSFWNEVKNSEEMKAPLNQLRALHHILKTESKESKEKLAKLIDQEMGHSLGSILVAKSPKLKKYYSLVFTIGKTLELGQDPLKLREALIKLGKLVKQA